MRGPPHTPHPEVATLPKTNTLKKTKYQDLEIEIGCCSWCDEHREIRVLRSPFDRPRAPLVLTDEQRREIGHKTDRFAKLLLKNRRHTSERIRLAREIGTELFSILFPEPLGDTLEQSLAALRSNQRLRLRLSFGEQDHRSLRGLPWELLYNPDCKTFLCTDRRTPIERCLDGVDPTAWQAIKPPFKVLAVIASPDASTSTAFKSYSDIDREHHSAILERSIGPATNLQLRFLEKPTLNALRVELQAAERLDTPYNAVHILCHGGFHLDQGVLLFEHDDRSEHLVSGAKLARHLTPGIQLITLASCKTARAPDTRDGSDHALASVASSLVTAGRPAVVAMQFTFSEDAAESFTTGFYTAINNGHTLSEALTQGRLTIEGKDDSDDLERATPVLIAQPITGEVLDLQAYRPPRKTVAAFTVVDKGKHAIEHADLEIDLQSYFEHRFIRSPDDWNNGVLEALRETLCDRLPQTNPIALTITAPLSVAYAAGFLLPAKNWFDVTFIQSGQEWDLAAPEPAGAPTWLSAQKTTGKIPKDFPRDPEAHDLAVVVGLSRKAIGGVKKYLRRTDLQPPKVRDVVYVCLARADQKGIQSGGHARALAEALVERLDNLETDYETTHIFLAAPLGFAFALGRLGHSLGRVQLYEFDFEDKRHKSYEPSITLTAPAMGEAP